MASWPDNGGRGVDGNNQTGFANPFTFFNPFSPTGFGSNSSSTSALPNPPAYTTGDVGFVSELFGRQTTAISNPTSAVASPSQPPFGSYHCGDHQLFRTNPGTGDFQNPAVVPFSGVQQFGSEFSLGSSATTSPFGNESPSYSSSSSTFGTISSGFRSSTTGPSTRSLVQENTSANNVSVFAPFTRTNLGIADIQGSRICSYAPTPEGDNIFSSSGSKLISISAMPFYQEKSHEELRAAGYQLTGRTGCQETKWSYETSPFGNGSPSYSSSSSTFGTISSGFRSSTTGSFTRSLVQDNTSANNVSVFAPFTRSNLGISGIPGTRRCSYATTPVVDKDMYRIMTSISGMPFYNEKSHEELRLEDYQLTGRTGSSIINTNSESSNQHNSSANNESVFAPVFVPFTNSDPGRSGCQGTKWSNETSRVEGNIPVSNATFSISSMLFNKEKGQEELRSSGDYQFTEKTGGYVTGAESSSSFPVINVSISVSPSFISSSSSSSTGVISGFCFSNPSVSSTCTSLIPTPSLPLHHPVISIPLSIKIGHLGDSIATTQTTNPVPTSGTVPATVTESVSTGGFTPRFCCSTDNRQQPISKCPVSVGQFFVANPVATEATVTLPTVQYGISGLRVSENAELIKGIPPMMNDRPLSFDQRTPPIEKYKPDDQDVMAMIPKLKCPEYFMEPSMDDLAANELKRPGFCRQVKDFVIGKRGYGSIKFLGETDVRNLDLESIIQFNNHEVIISMDKNAKPPVGHGLNKAAEITLLNVNCIDKNTGKQYIDGPKVDKYKQLLVRKTAEQGAEFVSFDPVKGEWKFKVQHF